MRKTRLLSDFFIPFYEWRAMLTLTLRFKYFNTQICCVFPRSIRLRPNDKSWLNDKKQRNLCDPRVKAIEWLSSLWFLWSLALANLVTKMKQALNVGTPQTWASQWLHGAERILCYTKVFRLVCFCNRAYLLITWPTFFVRNQGI